MSLRVALQVISGNYPKMMADAQRRMATAATGAMKDAGDLAKSGARSSIASGGFGAKWQNALRVDVYPKSDVSLSPAALVYHKIPYAGVFQDGATISGRPTLWIPLFSGKRMSPRQFAQQVGPLSLIRHPGKPPILATIVRTTDRRLGGGVTLNLLKKGFNPKTRGTGHIVPVYVGVPTVTDPQKFNIKPAVQSAADQLGELYAKNFKE